MNATAIRIVVTLPGGYAGLDGRPLHAFAAALEAELAARLDDDDDVREVEVVVNTAVRADSDVGRFRLFAPFYDDDGDKRANISRIVELASEVVWERQTYYKGEVTP